MLVVPEELPKGGGAFLVAWQLSGKRVLVVGGGEVASGRIRNALDADAQVTLIAPADGLHPTTRFFVDHSDRVSHTNRAFMGLEDLEDADMVLSAIDDVEESQRICTLCREQKIPVNVADIPPMCDFYFGSQIRQGPLQILISTNGNGPKLANIIKGRIENALPQCAGRAVENVGVLRSRLRELAPGTGGEISKRRMRWMSKVCTSWTLEDLAAMDKSVMDELLSVGWPTNPALERSTLEGEHQEHTRTNAEWEIRRQFLPVAVGIALGTFATLAMLRFKFYRSAT